MQTRSLASILAHVLATTTAIVACGGATADISDPAGSSSGGTGTGTGTSSGGSSSGTSKTNPPTSGTQTTTPPTLPPPDAGIKKDAGCTGPVLLGERGCSDVWQQVCGIPKDVNPADGLTQEECNKVCGANPNNPAGTYWGCGEYKLDDLPGPSFECYTCVEGRRPDGYVDEPFAPTIAGWLAHAADLERVSIDAFQILRRELEHHGAPAALLERIARAEMDEVRHARVLSALAQREGATLSSAPVAHGPVRALVDIALENAVEGCIRETYGALVAGWQADHATRLDVRRAMKPIYRDETAHAELAWSVHAWIMERLNRADRACVEGAMAEAVSELAVAARVKPQAGLIDALGLPGAREAIQLLEGLQIHLWSAASAAA